MKCELDFCQANFDIVRVIERASLNKSSINELRFLVFLSLLPIADLKTENLNVTLSIPVH